MKVPEFLAPQLIEIPKSGTGSPSADEPLGGHPTGESVGGRPSRALLEGFSIPPQERPNWCWAAVTVGIARFGLPSRVQTQCELATSALRKLKVINETSNCGCTEDGCDRAIKLSVPLTIAGVHRNMHSKAAKFENVVTEIMGRRPVACHVSWPVENHPGHFLAVGGYTDLPEEGRRIDVFDPDGTIDAPLYEEFLKRYTKIGGKWDYTYLIDYFGGRAAQQAHLSSRRGGLLSQVRETFARFIEVPRSVH